MCVCLFVFVCVFCYRVFSELCLLCVFVCVCGCFGWFVIACFLYLVLFSVLFVCVVLLYVFCVVVVLWLC